MAEFQPHLGRDHLKPLPAVASRVVKGFGALTSIQNQAGRCHICENQAQDTRIKRMKESKVCIAGGMLHETGGIDVSIVTRVAVMWAGEGDTGPLQPEGHPSLFYQLVPRYLD